MQTGEFDSLDAGPHSAGGAAEGTADNNNTATTTAIVIHAQIVSGVVTGKGTANEHVSYNILTTVRNSAQGLPRQFRIARRFSHFVTLHTQLGNVYADLAAASASAHIPELPSLPSKTLTKHKNPKFIAARREKLAVYVVVFVNGRRNVFMMCVCVCVRACVCESGWYTSVDHCMRVRVCDET